MLFTITCFVVLTVALAAINFDAVLYTRDNACIGGGIKVVSRPNNLTVKNENCNVKYDKNEWVKQPYVKYSEAEKGVLYTLMMLDPDAPKLTENQYYLHWLLANIHGEELKIGNLKYAIGIISKYQGPDPQVGKGFHKYQFLIYEQGEDQQRDLKDMIAIEQMPDDFRHGFSLEDWLKEQSNSTKILGPLTGVQFLSEFGST